MLQFRNSACFRLIKVVGCMSAHIQGALHMQPRKHGNAM